MKNQQAVGFLLASLLLAACTARVSTVGTSTKTAFHVIMPTGAVRYVLAKNQKFVLGEALSQGLPVYPAKLLSRRLPPQEVCLELTMDATGAVVASRSLYGSLTCPAAGNPVLRSFEDAARQAVAQWRFAPAKLCTYPAGVDAQDADNDCRGARVDYLPVKLAFDFQFVERHGVAAVKLREHR